MKTADDLLINSAARFPEKIAFKQSDYMLSYSDLKTYSDNMKHFILSIGILPFSPVIILADRDIDVIVSMYAILKIGAFFVPLNPNENQQRLQKIIEDCSSDFIITTERYMDIAMRHRGSGTIIMVTHKNKQALNQQTDVYHINYITSPNQTNSEQKVHHEKSIAYMIYTSGSSGFPKGVMIRHDSFINFIKETVCVFLFNSETKIISTKPFYFDGIMTDLFCVAYAGGTVVLSEENFVLPRKLINRILEERVSHLSVAPGVVKLLAESRAFKKNDFSFIKSFSFGADIVPADAIVQLKKDLPNVRFINRYGLTETTVLCSAFEVQSMNTEKKIPIGKPLKNISFYVFDETSNLVEPGMAGELYIGGCQVMAGYWNDENLTAEVIKHDIIEGEILFKTGDVVFQNLNGDYVFLGRKDSILSKNGFRVNISEIEEAIRGLDLVVDCVCLYEKQDSNAVITAFVKSDGYTETQILRDAIKYILPNHMIPEYLVLVEDIPFTGAGKPDKEALISCAANVSHNE